ncbi:DMT family transporter [Terrihabitans sp. B22-R8]|uniref:DMT family transporter n=1 Tax=Terrihabitans sp. B22-R8 TaxID=3425128 RepID=UPI00403C5AEA
MLAKVLYSSAALLAGIGFAFQGGINAGLARHIGSSLLAATISFSVGLIALTGLAAFLGHLPMSGGSLRSVPVWMWMSGGLLGASVVYSSVVLVPKLGVAAVASLIIAGQLLAAAIIDHYGLFGVPVHEIGPARIAGLFLLLSGAVIVRMT